MLGPKKHRRLVTGQTHVIQNPGWNLHENANLAFFWYRFPSWRNSPCPHTVFGKHLSSYCPNQFLRIVFSFHYHSRSLESQGRDIFLQTNPPNYTTLERIDGYRHFHVLLYHGPLRKKPPFGSCAIYFRHGVSGVRLPDIATSQQTVMNVFLLSTLRILTPHTGLKTGGFDTPWHPMEP